MNYKARIAAGLTSAALIASMAAPAAFADTTVEIMNNGKKSDNTVNVTKTNTVNVTQSNNLSVSLNINSKANSGGNKASDNTGGNVSINTGTASSTVGVGVTGGANIAVIEDCGCEEDTTVKVNENGRKSNNSSTVNNTKSKTASQSSTAGVTATIKSKAKTGKNKANDNTSGTVNVGTSGATSSTTVEVEGPVNALNPAP